MSNLTTKSMFILGVFVLFGLISLGYFLVESVNVYKQYDRTVTVKGLSQKDFKADVFYGLLNLQLQIKIYLI